MHCHIIATCTLYLIVYQYIKCYSACMQVIFIISTQKIFCVKHIFQKYLHPFYTISSYHLAEPHFPYRYQVYEALLIGCISAFFANNLLAGMVPAPLFFIIIWKSQKKSFYLQTETKRHIYEYSINEQPLDLPPRSFAHGQQS